MQKNELSIATKPENCLNIIIKQNKTEYYKEIADDDMCFIII